MPYKDEGKAKEAARGRMRKMRMLHPVTPDVTPTPTGVTKADVTPTQMLHPDVTPLPKEHPIFAHLVDPVWRLKMTKIITSLERRDLTEVVFVGVPGRGGVSVADVREYLKATEGIV